MAFIIIIFFTCVIFRLDEAAKSRLDRTAYRKQFKKVKNSHLKFEERQ